MLYTILMPFISHDDLEMFEANTRRKEVLESLFNEFEDLPGILRLAGVIKEEVSAALDDRIDLSTSEIGDLAYKKAYDAYYSEAHDEIVAKFEQDHRTKLYKQVIEEVEDSEGESIFKDVKDRLDTDPELAVELRESARKELAAKALGVVTQEITDEQQEIINEEAERQVELDRLDVEFAVDGELDLLRDDVTSLVEPGDVLQIYFNSGNARYKDGSVTLQWTSDVNSKTGWVAIDSDGYFYGSDGYSLQIPSDRFLTVGCVLPDLREAKTQPVANTLKAGTPLALTHNNSKGNPKTISSSNRTSEYNKNGNGCIKRIDFQTRILVFNK